MKEEMLNKDFWATNVDSAAIIGLALDSKHQDASLSSILEMVQAPINLNTKENPTVSSSRSLCLKIRNIIRVIHSTVKSETALYEGES
jgi:hypothetical protein